jgi:hypothetical protein
MSEPVADIVLVRTQILEHLLVNRIARYTDVVEGSNADYVVKQEITDAILICDNVLCSDVVATAGHPYRSMFMIPSSALANGDFIPPHIGEHGDVQVSVSGVYDYSIPAKSREEVLAMRRFASLYVSKRFHFIEDSVIVFIGDAAKVWYPSLTKTTVCRSHQAYEDILVYGSMQFLEKIDSEDAYFQKFAGLFGQGRQMIRSGSKIIPPEQELDLMMKAGGRQQKGAA